MRNTIVVPCIVNSSLYWAAVSRLPFGPASWSRRSNASTPPITKKASAVVPYMMPIFLWSIVVNQLQKPVVACGRRSTRRRRAGACTVSTVVIGALPRARSRQLEEVVGDLLRLLSRHRRLPSWSIAAERRHSDTLAAGGRLARVPARLRLHRDQPGRVVDPVHEPVASQLVVAARERRAAGQVGEVGPVGAHLRVGQRVAVRALELRADELLGGAGGLRLGAGADLEGHRRALLLLTKPLVVLARLLRDHPEAHVRVRQAAVLGALAEVRARLVGLDRRERLPARDDVTLPSELGDPEAVDHVALVGQGLVACREVYPHRPARGDHQLVRGDDVLARVLELPPPLLADRRDVDHVAGRLLGEVEDRDDRRDGHDGEDERGDDRPADLERGAAVDLLRVLVLAGPVAEADGEHDDGAEYEHPDDDRNEEDRREQVVDRPGGWALGLERVLAVLLAAAGREEQRRPENDRETRPSLGTRPEVPHPRLPITCPVIARATSCSGGLAAGDLEF